MGVVAKHKAMNAVSVGSENRPKRYLDDNGFLHVFLRFMRTGTLDYSPGTFPDGVPPDAVNADGKVTVMVEPGDLKDPDSLASLAGMPGLRRHEWAEPGKKLDQIGSVAGEPYYVEEDGVGYVECEAVITDAEIIRLLQIKDEDTSHPDYAKRLKEVSAAYHHEVPWESGEHEGKPYAGKQKNIRYNHFALLPEGEGRAGRDVRAINSKENEVADKKEEGGGVSVWSRVYKRLIRVMNADEAEEIAKADEEVAAEVENKEEGGGAPPPNPGGDGGGEAGPPEIKNLGKLLDELTKVKARAAELEGQLQVAQEKINELLSTDKVEAEAEAITAERDEAAEIMAENTGIAKEKAMNSIKDAKLRGHALRVFAMNSIREAQGKPAMDAEKAKDESFVLGMWNGVKEGAPVKKTVVGAFNTKAMNSVQDYRKQALTALGFDVK